MTAFHTDERCFWHSTGEHALIMPVGGWVEPPSGGGHAESPESKRRILNLVRRSSLAGRLDWRGGEPATEEDVRRVHDPAYLAEFERLSDGRGGELGLSAPFGPGSYEVAALSAGLVKAALADVLDGRSRNAYALSRPPGHHCLRDAAMGFCLMSNIGIAIEAARAERGLGKVAVVDSDVHHGNGTQAIFYDRPDVLTISLHQASCFPPGSGGADETGEGPGEGANVNVPLLPGGGHAAYMAAFDAIVEPALRRFAPEAILVASGLDANSFDPLGRMLAHSDTFRAMAERLVRLAGELCGGRVVCAHEGGYAEAVVPFCGLAVLEGLSGERSDVEDPFLPFGVAQQPPPELDALQSRLLAEQAEALGLVPAAAAAGAAPHGVEA